MLILRFFCIAILTPRVSRYEEALLKKMSMETFSWDHDPIISSNASSVGTLKILWQMSVANLSGEFSEAVKNKI